MKRLTTSASDSYARLRSEADVERSLGLLTNEAFTDAEAAGECCVKKKDG